jgi:hypothetical protein
MKEIVNNLQIGQTIVIGRLAIKKYIDNNGILRVKGMFLNDKQYIAIHHGV